jgi:hypothetical protein
VLLPQARAGTRRVWVQVAAPTTLVAQDREVAVERFWLDKGGSADHHLRRRRVTTAPLL